MENLFEKIQALKRGDLVEYQYKPRYLEGLWHNAKTVRRLGQFNEYVLQRSFQYTARDEQPQEYCKGFITIQGPLYEKPDHKIRTKTKRIPLERLISIEKLK